MIGQGVDGIGALVRRYRSWEWEMLGQEIVEYGSFVRRKLSGEWEGTERLYGAVREKSIDFLKILYRLSGKTL